MITLQKYIKEKLIINKDLKNESPDFINSSLLYRITLKWEEDHRGLIWVDVHKNIENGIIVSDNKVYHTKMPSAIFGHRGLLEDYFKLDKYNECLYNFYKETYVHFLFHENYNKEMKELVSYLLENESISLNEISKFMNYDFTDILNVDINLIFVKGTSEKALKSIITDFT